MTSIYYNKICFNQPYSQDSREISGLKMNTLQSWIVCGRCSRQEGMIDDVIEQIQSAGYHTFKLYTLNFKLVP